MSQVHATGDVVGGHDVGGLIGQNVPNLLEDSSAAGSVTGLNGVGGFIGIARGYVDAHTPSEIQRCTASGAVEGAVDVGGFIGLHNGHPNVSESVSLGDVSGESRVGGFLGKSSFYTPSGTLSDNAAYGTVEATGDYAGGFVGLRHHYRDGGGTVSVVNNVSGAPAIVGVDDVGPFVGDVSSVASPVEDNYYLDLLAMPDGVYASPVAALPGDLLTRAADFPLLAPSVWCTVTRDDSSPGGYLLPVQRWRCDAPEIDCSCE